MGRINNTIVQNQAYSFSVDYETLWRLRTKEDYTVVCTIEVGGSEHIATMTPDGEIFNREVCYSDFEGISKSQFIEYCEYMKVKYIIPDALMQGKKKRARRKKVK